MEHQKSFFITGIGTNVGKTVIAAILAESLSASYWKPVQSGDLEFSDSQKVKQWTDNVDVMSEKYRLTHPLSPHESAALDSVFIKSKLTLPKSQNPLIVEGAGGVLVPINEEGNTIADWLIDWEIPVIVVVQHYLGSINHTLLTVDYLKTKGIKIEGLVLTGKDNLASEKIIEKITGLNFQLKIPFSEKIDANFVKEQAEKNKILINKWLIG